MSLQTLAFPKSKCIKFVVAERRESLTILLTECSRSLRVPPYFASSDAIATIASEEAEEAMSCATCTRGGCYVMCLDGRTCLIANSVLYYNNVLHYEVAKDAEVAEIAKLANRAIRLIRSMTVIFIFISPLPRVHRCLGKVWRNPNM